MISCPLSLFVGLILFAIWTCISLFLSCSVRLFFCYYYNMFLPVQNPGKARVLLAVARSSFSRKSNDKSYRARSASAGPYREKLYLSIECTDLGLQSRSLHSRPWVKLFSIWTSRSLNDIYIESSLGPWWFLILCIDHPGTDSIGNVVSKSTI